MTCGTCTCGVKAEKQLPSDAPLGTVSCNGVIGTKFSRCGEFEEFLKRHGAELLVISGVEPVFRLIAWSFRAINRRFRWNGSGNSRRCWRGGVLCRLRREQSFDLAGLGPLSHSFFPNQIVGLQLAGDRQLFQLLGRNRALLLTFE